MAPSYPPRGTPEWDNPLKTYIDGRNEELRAAVMSLVGATSGVVNGDALYDWHRVDPSYAPRKVVVIGDSIDEGTFSSTWYDSWPYQAQTLLREKFGRSGGVGYVPAVPATGGILPAPLGTYAGTPQMWSHGLGGRVLYLGNVAHHRTFDAVNCTSFKVYFGKTSVAGGGLKVFVDGVDVTGGSPLVSASTTTSGGHVWDSGQLSPGSHGVRIEAFNPPFVGILEGVEFFNGDENSGVRVYNAAHSGATATLYTQASMDLHWQSVAAIQPDLIYVGLGVNDIASVTPAAFLASVDTLLSKVRTIVSPTVPVMLAGKYLRGDYNTPEGVAKWEQMQAGLAARAVGAVSYFDWAPHWPTLEADGSTSAGLMGDVPPIHPNSAGMTRIAEVVTDALSPSVFAGAYLPRPTDTGAATTANFTSLTSSINVAGKYLGRAAWNTTTGKAVWASGPDPADVWLFADGTTAHTPA